MSFLEPSTDTISSICYDLLLHLPPYNKHSSLGLSIMSKTLYIMWLKNKELKLSDLLFC